jgi:hypothetical protein
MNNLRDAARQALKSLRGYRREIGCEQPCDAERALEAAINLRAALEQPEQEPVAINCQAKRDNGGVCPHHNLQCGWPNCNKPQRIKLEQPNRAQKMTEAGYTRRPTLREMAAPEQEPVAWMDPNRGEVCRAHWLESHAPERDVDRFSCPLYTHPPRREWRGLTDAERAAVQYESFKRGLSPLEFMELHEAKLKERNA